MLMSYNFDGKVVNMWTSRTNNSNCSKCNKSISNPEVGQFNIYKQDMTIEKVYVCQHYMNLPHYIYETKSGTPVVYCSDYCRRKHNHRFNK